MTTRLALYLLLLISAATTTVASSQSCSEHIAAALQREREALAGISLAVHRNGEPDPCGMVELSPERMIQQAMESNFEYCSATTGEFTKYHMESFLTAYVGNELKDSGAACGPPTDDGSSSGLRKFCDMGVERTVVQNDYDSLVRLPLGNTLPCRWFTREGLRISTLSILGAMKQGAKDREDCSLDSETCAADGTIHIYAVPAGRVFMFATSFVGEKFSLNHVKDSEDQVVTMEVLSTNPRVFDITNFFSKTESDSLVNGALEQTDEVWGFHRSTTGTTGASVFNKRTSENAWDTSGAVAMDVKRRCFNLLGFDEYSEPLSDGLQILRYNLTTAYTPHMDYLEDRGATESYDYDSSGKGGNRFATILLYFTELEKGDGGETVFPKAWPPHLPAEERVQLNDAIQQLRDSGEGDALERGSWQEEMVAQCRTRLSVRPTAQRAVLFYSQLPNGEQDPMSFHGGCPVLKGTKLAANLWTWSGIRPEYSGAPRKFEEKPVAQVSAVFRNTGRDSRFQKAELFYDNKVSFGQIGHGSDAIYVNTYAGHVWHAKVDGEVKQTFVIGDEEKQTFEL